MHTIPLIITCLLLLAAFGVITYIIYKKTESFCGHSIQSFDLFPNTEMNGMNMLLNEDGYFPAGCPGECADICLRNKECKGFGFYAPGNRCYIYSSGGLIPERPGFISGVLREN